MFHRDRPSSTRFAWGGFVNAKISILLFSIAPPVPYKLNSPFKMSKTQHITSKNQFDTLLSSSRIVVADCKPTLPTPLCCLPHFSLKKHQNANLPLLAVYADWCGPCKQIAPIYERLSAELSRPSKITFTKVNVDNQTEIAQTYGITA